MLRHHWQGFAGGARGARWDAWRCEQLPGVIVRHCGHPTALRPYYVEGLEHPVDRKFARLVDALQAAEAATAGTSIEREPIPKSARPGRARLVDACQESLAF